MWIEPRPNGFLLRWTEKKRKYARFFPGRKEAANFMMLRNRQNLLELNAATPEIRDMTFVEAAELWISCRPMSEKSRQTVRSHFKVLTAAIPSKRAAEISRFEIDRAFQTLQSSQSPSTVRRLGYWCRSVFAYLEAEYIIPRSPASHLKFFRSPAREPNALDYKHEAVLLAAAGDQLRTILAMIDAGLRSDSVYSMQRRQIDFEEKTLSFVAAKSLRPMTLPLTARLHDSLLTVKNWPSFKFIFPRKAVYNPRRHSMNFWLTPIREKTGLKIRPHDLRHTFFIRMWRASQDKEFAEWCLGHKVSDYGHPGLDWLREEFSKMEARTAAGLAACPHVEIISDQDFEAEFWKGEKPDE